MPTNNRASLFQPFDSLKGLKEMFRQQEEILVPARILSEDDRDELDRRIHQIQRGQIIRVEYYDGHVYRQVEGIVSKINLDICLLQIVQTKIPVKHIVSIETEL